MSPQEFEQACRLCVRKLRELAPKDTGNLAYNAIQYRFPDENTCEITVNEDIAPYMPYTNEPWISPYWRGKKNPNEGWFGDAADTIATLFAQIVKGEIRND